MLTITYHRVTKYTQRSFTRKEHNALIANGCTWNTYVALLIETSSVQKYYLQALVSQSNHSMSCIPSCCTRNGRLWSNLIELDAHLESLTVGINWWNNHSVLRNSIIFEILIKFETFKEPASDKQDNNDWGQRSQSSLLWPTGHSEGFDSTEDDAQQSKNDEADDLDAWLVDAVVDCAECTCEDPPYGWWSCTKWLAKSVFDSEREFSGKKKDK